MPRLSEHDHTRPNLNPVYSDPKIGVTHYVCQECSETYYVWEDELE